jgi:maspardin
MTMLLPPDFTAWTARLPLRRFTDGNGNLWSWRDNLREAPALVLLPGALGNGDMAWRLAEAMSETSRTLTVTYPSGLAAAQLAGGLVQLIDHLGLDTVGVWGSSYGAWWAQALAVRHPHRVQALWLANMPLDSQAVAAHPLFDAGWLVRSSAADVVQAWRDALASRPDSELRTLQDWMLAHGLPAEAFRARLLQVAHADRLPAAEGIGRLVVSDCADDAILDAVQRERVRARYPKARHVGFPTGGHYPHVTQARELADRLRSWLET